MVQGGRRLGLPAEPRLEDVVAGHVVFEGFDGDEPVEAQIACAVDLGHTATPDNGVELVASAKEPGLGHVVY